MDGTSATEIAASIENDVQNGTFQPGQKLRSVRQLAADLGVSPTTVSAAYRRLRERGVVIGRGRQGTRVAPRVGGEGSGPTLFESDLGDAIDAMTGTPDATLLPSLGPALATAASAPATRYGDQMVHPPLARIASEIFTADSIDASHMTVTSGAMDAIDRIISSQNFRVGDRIGVEDPGHIPVHQLARSAGLELVPIPVDDEGITSEGLTSALNNNLAAVVLTPRGQNPTGAAFTLRRTAELSDVMARRPDVMLIQDDHAGPVAGVEYVSLQTPGGRWATIRSLGKSLGPDVRLAMVAGDQNTIDGISRSVSNGPGWVSHLLQRAATELLSDAEVDTLIATASASYSERRNQLINALADRRIGASGRSGLNVWIPVNDEVAAVQAVSNAGYAIRGAGPYRIVSPPAVRVTVSNLTETDFTRIADALAEHKIGGTGPSRSPLV